MCGRKKGKPQTTECLRLGKKNRRRPTLPQARPAVPSAMGPFTSVFGMGTGVSSPLRPPEKSAAQSDEEKDCDVAADGSRTYPGVTALIVKCNFLIKKLQKNGQAARLISIGQLSPLLDLHLQPIEVVVFDRPSDPFGWENLSLGRLGA